MVYVHSHWYVRDARHVWTTAAHLWQARGPPLAGRGGSCLDPRILPQTLSKELGPNGSDVGLQATEKLPNLQQKLF